MKPLTAFESHFRAAQGLLKVYRLLETESQTDNADLEQKLRDLVPLSSGEGVVLLFNDLVVGLVRERAEMPSSFFRQINLALLLRQSVVSACTAMDVFFPALLDEYLPEVIRVRQRTWQPMDGDAKDLLRDFRLKVEDLPALLEAENLDQRWQLFAAKVIAHLREKTLANPQGIQATMTILGVTSPWERIAEKSGTTAQALRLQVQNLSKRRNDIIHRGDRTPTQIEDEPNIIDYAWANAHINALNSTVTACDALARDAVRSLTVEAAAS